MIGKAGLVEADFPDLQQDLWLELLSRIPDFRADRGSPRAFITLVIRNKRATIFAERLAAKRGKGKPCHSLDDEHEEDDGDTLPLHETISIDDYLARTRGLVRTQEDIRDLGLDVRALVNSLKPKDRVVCLLLIDRAVSNVAGVVGVPRRSLRDVISRLRMEALDWGLQEYFGKSRHFEGDSGK